ncbi:MAG: biopolymer transporter ExbD [Bacteroidales bacterium]|jgi:biopolymer transport protein ExbD|nr:biopolymer transporter ExbD [Bacteroidales bacterium]
MGKFRKEGKKEVPQVSTSSLPDIVYMLIFFFMITTSMRDVELRVKTALPKATEIAKLEKKALVSSIYIGPPRDAKLGTESRIQLNDQFARPDDIADWVLQEREARNEADRPFLTTALKVHKETRMGIVTDVKQELRKVGAFRINYTTLKGSALEN